MLERRARTVSVCVPTLDEAPSIERTLAPLVALLDDGLVDQVAVVDSGSADRTRELAGARGAEVHDARALMPEAGPLLGKGDALWRALSVVNGDIVCFVDADSEDFGEHFVTGLTGPLLEIPGVEFVKGSYRRPLRLGERVLPQGGGRVTELTARPLLNAFYPDLAVFAQPLAGEIAANRGLLLRLPFDSGYGVEVGDADRRLGPGRARRDGRGRPRHATEPTPRAVGAHADGGDRAPVRGRPAARRGATHRAHLEPAPLAEEPGAEPRSVRVVQRPPMAAQPARGAA